MTDTTTDPAKRKLSPRRRARRIRLAQYALLVVIVVVAALAADWKQVGSTFFDPDMIRATLTQGIGSALFNTVVYTIGAFAFGMVAGTVLALMRLSSVGPYRWIATAYIEFFS